MSLTIYYIPLDEEFRESGQPVPITLLVDHTADITRLPKKLQEQLTLFGVPDPTHTNMLFPKDGETFLEALLDSSNLYRRFRDQFTKPVSS